MTHCTNPTRITPGLNATRIAWHGYKSFGRGSSDGNNFIGWNGLDGTTNYSQLLEDLFTVRQNQQYFKKVLYYTNENGYQDAALSFTKPMFPRGRCILISPDNSTSLPVKYLLILTKTYVWPNVSDPLVLTVYLTDSVNSIQFNPLAFEMQGDRVSFNTEDLKKASYGYEYKTRTSKFVRVKGDPALNCAEYNKQFSYDDCVKNEIAGRFNKEISCVPPWFADDQQPICDKVFNLTAKKDKEIKKMFRATLPFKSFDCPIPCTGTVYNTQFLTRSPTYDPLIVLHFSPVVSVTRSRYQDTSVPKYNYIYSYL